MSESDLQPVVLTPEENAVLRSLVRAAQLDQQDVEAFGAELVEDEGEDTRVRRIVREEIASLAGLALRRTQDRKFSRDPDRNLAQDVANTEAAQFWGEVLAEYGGSWPGEQDA